MTHTCHRVLLRAKGYDGLSYIYYSIPFTTTIDVNQAVVSEDRTISFMIMDNTTKSLETAGTSGMFLSLDDTSTYMWAVDNNDTVVDIVIDELRDTNHFISLRIPFTIIIERVSGSVALSNDSNEATAIQDPKMDSKMLTDILDKYFKNLTVIGCDLKPDSVVK